METPKPKRPNDLIQPFSWQQALEEEANKNSVSGLKLKKANHSSQKSNLKKKKVSSCNLSAEPTKVKDTLQSQLDQHTIVYRDLFEKKKALQIQIKQQTTQSTKLEQVINIVDAKQYLEEREFQKNNPECILREQWQDLAQGAKEIKVPQTRACVQRALTKHRVNSQKHIGQNKPAECEKVENKLTLDPSRFKHNDYWNICEPISITDDVEKKDVKAVLETKGKVQNKRPKTSNNFTNLFPMTMKEHEEPQPLNHKVHIQAANRNIKWHLNHKYNNPYHAQFSQTGYLKNELLPDQGKPNFFQSTSQVKFTSTCKGHMFYKTPPETLKINDIVMVDGKQTIQTLEVPNYLEQSKKHILRHPQNRSAAKSRRTKELPN